MGNTAGDVTILFTEGSSLSARQSLTALGMLGYRIDICDPNPRCLCRFTKYIGKLHQFPGMARDPQAYFDRVLALLESGSYDVLLPTHEQAYLFSRVQQRVANLAGLAVPPFESIDRVQSKTSFARLLDALDLPQPQFSCPESVSDLHQYDAYPYYVKTAYSTAGRGVWRVSDAEQRQAVADELDQRDLWRWGVMAQDSAEGRLCQAQAVFCHGVLVGAHCTTQRAVGVGGSQAARGSVDHPRVIEHLRLLGTHLDWHGAMALDYLYDPATGPSYIECNPRLVEPMNAVMGGVNLAEMMVRLSLGESLSERGTIVGKPNVNTHSVMSVILGQAELGGTRRDILGLLAEAALRRGVFDNSREDLTPLRHDPHGVALPMVAAMAMLVKPGLVHGIAGGTISHYSVTPEAASTIAAMPV